MNQVFEWAPGVKETQIVQNSLYEIEVRMVPDLGFDEQRDRTILETELRKRIGASVRIRFIVVESIPRTKNGKFRAVVSNLKVESDAERELRSSVEEGLLSGGVGQ